MTDINHPLDGVHRIHFVGIGGSGMSPLAEILHARGYQISGSDHNESDNLNRIRALGIPVTMGHAAANIDGAQLVVYTVDIPADNPELTAARERGIPLLERAKLLGWITRQYTISVAVAGTHGKTTSTSMLSQILLQAGEDPSLFIGGRLPLIGANGHAGTGEIMVCEACEFQNHYLEMAPTVGVILNVDADHLDYFGDLAGVIRSFRQFAAQTTGAIIYNADDENTRRALEGMRTALETTELSPPVFYPVMMGKDNVLRLTQEQVGGFLRGFQRMFDVARLVDPEICMELSLRKRRPGVGKSDHCYAVWSRMKRCERCVSQEVVRTQKS